MLSEVFVFWIPVLYSTDYRGTSPVPCLPDTRPIPLGYRYQGTLHSVVIVPIMFTQGEYIFRSLP